MHSTGFVQCVIFVILLCYGNVFTGRALWLKKKLPYRKHSCCCHIVIVIISILTEQKGR